MELKNIIKEIATVLNKNSVKYCFIGKGATIIHGLPFATFDVDIFPYKSPENANNIIASLKELQFNITQELEEAIKLYKDLCKLGHRKIHTLSILSLLRMDLILFQMLIF